MDAEWTKKYRNLKVVVKRETIAKFVSTSITALDLFHHSRGNYSGPVKLSEAPFNALWRVTEQMQYALRDIETPPRIHLLVFEPGGEVKGFLSCMERMRDFFEEALYVERRSEKPGLDSNDQWKRLKSARDELVTQINNTYYWHERGRVLWDLEGTFLRGSNPCIDLERVHALLPDKNSAKQPIDASKGHCIAPQAAEESTTAPPESSQE